MYLFERWRLRPVYKAQCRTWARAAQMNLCYLGFRALPPYRDAAAQRARTQVAHSIKADRARVRTQATIGLRSNH